MVLQVLKVLKVLQPSVKYCTNPMSFVLGETCCSVDEEEDREDEDEEGEDDEEKEVVRQSCAFFVVVTATPLKLSECEAQCVRFICPVSKREAVPSSRSRRSSGLLQIW